MKRIKRFWIIIVTICLLVFIPVFTFFPLPGYIPVLMYHFIYPERDVIGGKSTLNVGVDSFRHQMWFLKTFGYRAISLDELYEIKSGIRKPRGKEVVITFDDGHRGYFHYALPILEQYQLKSANFLIWQHLTDPFWKKDYVTLEEAQKFSLNSLVTFGAHTIHHQSLTEMLLSEARSEIVQSKSKLEQAFNKEFHYFCYPTGATNPEIMNLVQQAGYRLAFTTSKKRLAGHPSTPYSLIRIKITPKYNLFMFWLSISGLYFYSLKIRDFFHQLTLSLPSGKLIPYKPGHGTT